MTVKNGDMPAMPIFPDTGAGHAAAHHGLTKREQFAMAAMQGLLASDTNQEVELLDTAEFAVGMAEILLQELKRTHD